MKEWIDVIHRDYNHPCIVEWVMLNESWGVPRIGHDRRQQSFAKSLYHLAHSLDDTRLVISNDGWEMVDTDICAIHSYKHGEEGNIKQQQFFNKALKSMDTIRAIVEKPVFAQGIRYQGQPVVLTEFGGICILDIEEQGWGYTSIGKEQFLEVYARVLQDVYESEMICGFCYTQLADIEQEINGLLTEEHEYKFEPEQIREIIDMPQRY